MAAARAALLKTPARMKTPLTSSSALWILFGILIFLTATIGAADECPNGEKCSSDETPKIQEVTATPAEPPKSLDMLAEDHTDSATTNSSTEEEPKGRALNFTMDGNGTGNVLSTNQTAKEGFGDLSDVTIEDDEEENGDGMNQEHPEEQTLKILAPKTEMHNLSHSGICEKGGLTYENGEKLEDGCETICTCMNGKMDCTDRCTGPYFRRGKKIEDPLCTAKEAEDPCCSILVCAADTETEPLEMCTLGNRTYNRGDAFFKDCNESCKCEAGGKIACKPRCPIVKKTSDRCLEVPDPNDPCCKHVVCDVTLDDKDEDNKFKLLSAKFLNSSTVELEVDPKNTDLHFIEASGDKKNWKTYQVRSGKYVEIHEESRYLKLENSENIIQIESKSSKKQEKLKDGSMCSYKGATYKLNEEYNDNCTSLCVCKETGMKCLKLECPTYFGVDVLDPNCVEWETVPPHFVPSPPNCCPDDLKCKSNGSCEYQGHTYQNWQQLPTNVTGCEKRCYCEMGKVECQNTCPPVTALPPPNLKCNPQDAMVDHLPDDDCCMYWVCKPKGAAPGGLLSEPPKNVSTEAPYKGPFALLPTKPPSKVLGPLVVYTNNDEDVNATKPTLTNPDENPFFNRNKDKFPGPLNPNYTKKPPKSKPSKDEIMFVTPPSTNENYIPEMETIPKKPPHIQMADKTPEEILQFIQQHPEIANYPSGSVLEVHNFPGASPQRPPPHFVNHQGPPPNTQQVIPYLIAHGGNLDELPPGVTLDQILQEIQKTAHLGPGHVMPYPPDPNQYPNTGHVLVAPQSGPAINNPNMTYHKGQGFPGVGAGAGPGSFPGFPATDEISVASLEPVDSHTVRLVILVPSVIVGLHGRVEVRYTSHDEENLNDWQLQVFAPPNDLIATIQMEFELLDLKPDTEYKIKIIVTLRDLHNTPSSRVYKIRTPKDTNTTTLPPMIPIEPELAINDINSTWVTVAWRKFTEYELQFIDGVQIRFKEIDGKIYDATPLIHRSVTSYILENLKPNTKYEIGIFFIPFPGQLTELHAEHMLHFTTANEVDTYGFNVTLEISHIKSTSVEIAWSGVPYPEDKYVNIYRAIYQSDSGKEDQSTFKIAKRDSPTKTVIMDLKPGTRYRLWLEVYLTNGKIKTSNVQDFITKPRAALALGTASQQGEHREGKGDYYGPLVIVAILASIAIMSTLILLLILVRRHNQNKAAITPPTRVSQSAYDNPTYKVEIQQETMGL